MIYKDHLEVKISIPQDFNIPDYIDVEYFEEAIFDANIVYSTNTSHHFRLQILFESHSPIYQLVEYFKEGEVNFLKMLIPSSENDHSILSFEDSKIITIEDDGGHWENGKRYFVITIDKCDRIGNSDIVIPLSSFSLSENGIWLIDKLFEYKGFYYDQPNKFEAVEKESKKIEFGDFNISFKVSFELFPKEKVTDWDLRRWAYVEIIPSSLPPKIDTNKLKITSECVMTLISFYQNQMIIYTYAQIKIEDKYLEFLKTTKHNAFTEPSNSRFVELNIDIYDYLNSCNSKSLIENYDFIKKLIERYIFSSSLEGESEFMLLYNILEQVRNFFIAASSTDQDMSTITDEYLFTVGKEKADKFIKGKIKEVGEIITEKNKIEFSSNAYKKVSFIKKLLMSEQFNQFFSGLNINLEEYQIDFDVLLKLRNGLFHGHDISTDKTSLNQETIKLRCLVFDLIYFLLKGNKSH